jgi:hypothetical protein
MAFVPQALPFRMAYLDMKELKDRLVGIYGNETKFQLKVGTPKIPARLWEWWLIPGGAF